MSLFELRSDSPALPRAPRRPFRGAIAACRHGAGGTPWPILLAIAALGTVVLAVAGGPVLLNGDGVWHLIWGRALAQGELASFATGPTPHPSLLLLGAVTSALGDDAGYTLTYAIFGPLAFGALLAAVFEVARRIASTWAALLAVAILATGGVVALAAPARYDVAFAALVMAAVALEIARPRRGLAPLACLAVAGLVRPEAWFLAGLYWLWLLPGRSWRARVAYGALAAAAPALWATMDLLVTGDPLYSLHATEAGSEVLYGRFTTWENMRAAGGDLVAYLGVVPLLLAPAGMWLSRRRSGAWVPLLATLAVTLGIFLALLSQGIASSERYLLVPVCALAVLAAAAVDGARARTRASVVAGVVLTTLLCLHAATRLDVYDTARGFSERAQARFDSARALVALPGVRAALRDCPVVSLPSGNLRHLFAFPTGRPPERFTRDPDGKTRPDVYIAPGSAAVAEATLTRRRFDADASFRVPPGLRPGPRNADWALYVSPASSCAGRL